MNSKRNWGIQLTTILGWLSIIAGLSKVDGTGFENLKVGIVMVIGSWAYKSALNRRLGIYKNSYWRKTMEIIGITAFMLMIFLQKDIKDMIANEPAANFIVPFWALIAYLIVVKRSIKEELTEKQRDRTL